MNTTELTFSVAYTSYNLKPKQYFGFKFGSQKFCSIVVKYDLGEMSDLKKMDTGAVCHWFVL